jgi:hypothetical protein
MSIMKLIKYAKSIALIAFITIVLIIIIEIALRIFNFAPSVVVAPIFDKNLLGDFAPNIHVINKMPINHPYTFTTNNQGFRSLHEIAQKKEHGAIRILCLGDSYTMGWGVNDEQTYPELLLKCLQIKFPGINFEVINAGFLFSNVLDHIDYFREKGRRLNADIVIEQFCYNDIDTDMRRYQVGRQALRTKSAQFERTASELTDIIVKNTSLGALAAQLKASFLGKDADLRDLNGRDLDAEVRIDDDLNSLLIPPTEENFKLFSNFAVLDAEKINSQRIFWDNYLKGVSILKNEVERSGGKFIFLAIPTQYQVEDIRDGHSAVFCPFTSENNITYIDMNPVFRAETKKSASYFFLNADGHTSSKGNAIIAHTITETIALNETLEVKKMACQLNYTNAQNLIITYDENKNELETRPSSPLFDNVSIENTGLLKSDGSPAFLSPAALDGELSIDLHFNEPISRAEVLTFRRLFNDKTRSNYIKMYSSAGDDPKTSLEYSFESDLSNVWDGAECAKVDEINFPYKVSHLKLAFVAHGKAGLVLGTNQEPKDSRRIQISVFR